MLGNALEIARNRRMLKVVLKLTGNVCTLHPSWGDPIGIS